MIFPPLFLTSYFYDRSLRGFIIITFAKNETHIYFGADVAIDFLLCQTAEEEAVIFLQCWHDSSGVNCRKNGTWEIWQQTLIFWFTFVFLLPGESKGAHGLPCISHVVTFIFVAKLYSVQLWSMVRGLMVSEEMYTGNLNLTPHANRGTFFLHHWR